MIRSALPNFTEGDYVLVARNDFTAKEKLSLRWRGPRRIIKAINDYVYQVEDLRSGELQDVHATRLKFYHDRSLGSEDTLEPLHQVYEDTPALLLKLLQRKNTLDDLTTRARQELDI